MHPQASKAERGNTGWTLIVPGRKNPLAEEENQEKRRHRQNKLVLLEVPKGLGPSQDEGRGTNYGGKQRRLVPALTQEQEHHPKTSEMIRRRGSQIDPKPFQGPENEQGREKVESAGGGAERKDRLAQDQ